MRSDVNVMWMWMQQRGGRVGPGWAGRPHVPARFAQPRHAQLPGASQRSSSAHFQTLFAAPRSSCCIQAGIVEIHVFMYKF